MQFLGFHEIPPPRKAFEFRSAQGAVNRTGAVN
jgi:hypothetical protein